MSRLSRYRQAAILFVVCCVAVLLLTNTRFGVWLLLDAFPDGDEASNADPRSGPILISEFRSAEPASQLPGGIEQPSGISYVEDADRFFVSTDQAELFVLDGALSAFQSSKVLARKPLILRQGSVEAATAISSDSAIVAGEMDSLELWRWAADDSWYRDAIIEISGYDGEIEFAGVAYNPDSDEYYAATDEAFEVLVLDAAGAVLRTIALTEGLDLKAGRALSEYAISGLDYAEGKLYVLTETYNTILVIDSANGIERIVGVEGGGQLAAIAIANGRAYMPVDHNWNEERPPLYVVDLTD
ncbi:MAG: hypothetical protein ACJ0SL_02475 [Candidatus Rariloculaceae bacterium]